MNAVLKKLGVAAGSGVGLGAGLFSSIDEAFASIPGLSAYAIECAGESSPVPDQLASEVISLPMHADLDEAAQRVVAAVRDSVRAAETNVG